MTDLSRDQRRALETAIKAARQEAEAAAADALRRMGVAEAEAPAHLDAEKRKQRNRLRAHARALGDTRSANGAQTIARLTEQAAYVQWHRLLFARFLIERKLLREETGAAVSLNDCREIAFGEGAGADEWSVAAGFAAAMLPGVFPPDDPVESLVLAPEHARTLRQRLLGMEAAIFQADDSLGWTYQFWRAAEKASVNEATKAGLKIGATELPAVTQLFTEPYMVRFLLHNTLGAWWAGKRLAAEPALACGAADEAALRAACALPGYAWEYLRFVHEEGLWRPAAGTFLEWPTTAKALTVLDPCCGSGHFLTEALAALTALRVTEEGLSPTNAVSVVLKENLAGLEIDGRCVQIAAFALALTAWRIGGPGVLPTTPNVAWVGARPPLPKAEFAAMADGDNELRLGLEALHDLFVQAPLLGSLLQPVAGDLADPLRVAHFESSLSTLVEKMRGTEPERAEGALAARGMADAAIILARLWTLQVTNVPFLGRPKQDTILARFISEKMPEAKADLATAMLTKMEWLAASGGTVAAVSGQNWWYLGLYKEFRSNLLNKNTAAMLVQLGDNAFQTPMYSFNVGLTIFSKCSPSSTHSISVIDAKEYRDLKEKADFLTEGKINRLNQNQQKRNPGQTITVQRVSLETPLGEFADSFAGVCTGDYNRFGRTFWEVPKISRAWRLQQTTSEDNGLFGGYSQILFWEEDAGSLRRFVEERLGTNNAGSWLRGHRAWNKRGLAVKLMNNLPVKFYEGTLFDDNVAVLIPKNHNHLDAMVAYCTSEEFAGNVRKLNQKTAVKTQYLLNVPFDLSRWTEIAAKNFPAGLPEPYSDDPTQWIFHGHPRYAVEGTALQVALARLAGYRWPAETGSTMRLSTEARSRTTEVAALPPSDADGLLPLTPLLGERGLADRLRAFCVAAWGADWKPTTEAALVAAACELAKDKRPAALTLDAWLRTHAARQHAKLFHDRPFLWWITDGRADGFCAIAHYHRLTKDKLERLAFQMLGDYLTRLGDDPRAEAGRILQRKLERIIEGEAPFDIFVRWKPLHAQPMGWEPDLDDGVRLNIRPFIEAGVLAHVPNVKYGVDRGKDVASAPWYGMFNGERRNDHHTTLAEKRPARANQGSHR